jgi:hypothetical protein
LLLKPRISGGAGKGNFCEGSSISKSFVQNADVGLGDTGGISLPINDNGSSVKVEGISKGIIGLGGGVGLQVMSCTTQTLCKKLTP